VTPRPLPLDTDVVVNFLRGHPDAAACVTANQERLILSAVVVAQLYAGVRDGTERTALDEFVGLFRVVPANGAVAAAAGLYRRDYGPSHGVSLADALLAATAEAESADPGTLNTRHFPMLAGLRPAYTPAG